MTQKNEILNNQLKQFIERIETLENTRNEIGEEIREVYTEAKNHGLEPKIMRTVIKIRRMDPEERQEHKHLLSTYLLALGMVVRKSGESLV